MEQINAQRAMTAFAEADQTPPSTSSTRPERPVPPVIAEIIAKMAVRYPPSGQADLTGRAERLLLLSQDVADVPARYLEAAVKKLARESVFMPKAAELIAAAREARDAELGQRAGESDTRAHLQALCDRYNALERGPGCSRTAQWTVVGSGPGISIAFIG